MTRIEKLREAVRRLYGSKNPSRDPIADRLFENHIFQVAEEARKVAQRFGGDPDLAEAAGLLHDIADAVMSRFDSEHSSKSEVLARSLLREAGFTNTEITTIVDDAMKYHSCRAGNLPQTLEGKAVATGDAVVHLSTDFYSFMTGTQRKRGESEEKIQEWVSEKLERDFQIKISYDEVRNEMAPEYEKLVSTFAK